MSKNLRIDPQTVRQIEKPSESNKEATSQPKSFKVGVTELLAKKLEKYAGITITKATNDF